MFLWNHAFYDVYSGPTQDGFTFIGLFPKLHTYRLTGYGHDLLGPVI